VCLISRWGWGVWILSLPGGREGRLSFIIKYRWDIFTFDFGREQKVESFH
jgi:hypothetical protein